MDKELYVVLMAGGSGTRFWPYSRKAKPKQFLDVLGVGKTLIQSAYERFLPLCPAENILTVTTPELAAIAQSQLGVGADRILVEPAGKNTAPCIAYACHKIRKRSAKAIIVVSPADHLILNESAFRQAIEQAAAYARAQNELITLGIKPTRPETGYGYIEFEPSPDPFKRVERFIEKPTAMVATQLIEAGNFVWNSGIFIWSGSAICTAFAKHQPAMEKAFDQLTPWLDTPQEQQAAQEAYSKVEAISIDYALMEKASNTRVHLVDFAWSDLGSWGSLHELRPKDENGNIVDAHAMVYQTRNSIISGPSDKLIVAYGMDGYLIGDFGDALIVCPKDQEQLFRLFIADLKADPENRRYL